MPVHIPPLHAHVRALPGVFYLCSEVATTLDLSPSSVRRIGRRYSGLGPSHETYYGKIRVDLYDDDVVARLALHVAANPEPRGRPRRWDDEQRRIRRARHSAAGYYRRRAVALKQRGDDELAIRADKRATSIVAELRDQPARAE